MKNGLMEKKKILCYGDSNTWGCNPADGSRFGDDVRWPMVLAASLGPEFSVIEDAKCGRTVLDLNSDPELNGISWIEGVMESCIPLFAAIICLGTNDVFDAGEIQLPRIVDGIETIARSIVTVHAARRMTPPGIILLTPVMPAPQPEEMNFYRLQLNKAAALIAEYPLIASRTGSLCLDISGKIYSSTIDGAHLDYESHKSLGHIVADFFRAEVL